MNQRFNFLRTMAGIFFLAMAIPVSIQAGVRTLSLPSYLANPDSVIEVPLSLDNASGLAALTVQINFDPEVLELLTVDAGTLGGGFEMSRGDDVGVVKLVFARATALAGGAGHLAVLKFRVNAGAVQDLYSELAIADVDFSDSTGVIDLRQKDSLTIANGKVSVTTLPNIDNAHNNLPDWWEQQYGLSLYAANASLDTDHDGLPNFLEYAFGGNPNVADRGQRGVQLGATVVGGQTFLGLGFYRRTGDASLHFKLQESENLTDWTDLNLSQQIMGTPQSMGDGTEFVSVRGTIPATGVNAKGRAFLKVAVDQP